MPRLQTPVLFLGFNRPDKSQKVFNAIRSVQPTRLFIALDGPRNEYPTDIRKCEQVKKVVEEIGWECKVSRLYRDKNLGNKEAVSSAIDWFFSEVEEGIILEDDCLPSRSFFNFCSDLLADYREESGVMMISGHNRLEFWQPEKHDYFFSNLGGIWGWATWKNSWMNYDKEMKELKKNLDNNFFQKLLGKKTGKIRENQFIAQKLGEVDTWDYQWGYSRHLNHGLSVVPSKNLVKNIGFDGEATHTNAAGRSEVPFHELEFPLKKNNKIKADKEYDDLFFTNNSKLVSFLRRIRFYIHQHLS